MRLVLLALIPTVAPLLRLVFFIVVIALTFFGAVQVPGLATIRPLRDPLVHLYLRTTLFPVLPNIGVAPSSTSFSIIISRNLFIFAFS